MKNEKVFYDLIMSYLHKEYVWHGDNPNTGIDCSNLVVDILKTVGIYNYSGGASSQYLFNMLYQGEFDELKLGSICFYGRSVDQIHHCGIMLNEDLIMESGGGTSKTSSIEKAREHNARVRIRKYDYRTDLISVVNPSYFFSS